MTDHQWLVLEHLGTFGTLLSFCIGIWIWLETRAKKKFKALVREAVAEEIGPVKERVEEIDKWYQVVSKAFGSKKANGHAAGLD